MGHSQQEEAQELAESILSLPCLREPVLTQLACPRKIARLLMQPGHPELKDSPPQAVPVFVGHLQPSFEDAERFSPLSQVQQRHGAEELTLEILRRVAHLR